MAQTPQKRKKRNRKTTFSQLMPRTPPHSPNVWRQIDDENRMSPGALLSPFWDSCQCVNSNLIRGMGLKRARSEIRHRVMGAVPIILANYCLLLDYLTWSLWRAERDTAVHLPHIFISLLLLLVGHSRTNQHACISISARVLTYAATQAHWWRSDAYLHHFQRQRRWHVWQVTNLGDAAVNICVHSSLSHRKWDISFKYQTWHLRLKSSG